LDRAVHPGNAGAGVILQGYDQLNQLVIHWGAFQAQKKSGTVPPPAQPVEKIGAARKPGGLPAVMLFRQLAAILRVRFHVDLQLVDERRIEAVQLGRRQVKAFQDQDLEIELARPEPLALELFQPPMLEPFRLAQLRRVNPQRLQLRP
jgi:hypothetical protein